MASTESAPQTEEVSPTMKLDMQENTSEQE